MTDRPAQESPELQWLAEEARRGTLAGRSGKRFSDCVALSSSNNLHALGKLVRELKPRRSLEIGFAFGGSALVLAKWYRESGAAPQGQHMAIDPFQHSVWDQLGRIVLEKAGLAEFVDVREEYSALVLPQLLKENARFDMIYIDGSHIFEDVFVDSYFAIQLLSDRGIVLFDDSTDPHVRKVLRFLDANFNEICQRMDLSPYRAQLDGGARLRYKLAHALGKVQLTAYRKTGPTPRKWDAPFHAF